MTNPTHQSATTSSHTMNKRRRVRESTHISPPNLRIPNRALIMPNMQLVRAQAFIRFNHAPNRHARHLQKPALLPSESLQSCNADQTGGGKIGSHTLNCTVRPRYTGLNWKATAAAAAEKRPHWSRVSVYVSRSTSNGGWKYFGSSYDCTSLFRQVS